MPSFSSTPFIGQDFFSESTINEEGIKLGALAFDAFGNRYRYSKAGGSNLVTADLCQEPAEDAQFASMTTTAHAIGSTAIAVTNGTTTVTAGMFNGGRLTIASSTGIGQSFYILSHTTGTSGASITYTIDRPLKIALDTNSKVTVRKNPHNGVIINPATTSTGGPVGFTLLALTAAYFGWLQSGGDTAVRFDTGANTANDLLGIEPSLAVAGNVKVSAGTSGDAYIGYAISQVASVDSEVSLARIIID